MLNVYLWVIENVFEWVEWNVDIGMIEMFNGKGEDVDDEKVLNVEFNYG